METVGKQTPSSLTVTAKINLGERGKLVALAGLQLIGSVPQMSEFRSHV